MSTVTAVVAGRDGGKLTADHLTRSAVVYVRQSTLQQVERHQDPLACNTPWSSAP